MLFSLTIYHFHPSETETRTQWDEWRISKTWNCGKMFFYINTAYVIFRRIFFHQLSLNIIPYHKYTVIHFILYIFAHWRGDSHIVERTLALTDIYYKKKNTNNENVVEFASRRGKPGPWRKIRSMEKCAIFHLFRWSLFSLDAFLVSIVLLMKMSSCPHGGCIYRWGVVNEQILFVNKDRSRMENARRINTGKWIMSGMCYWIRL